MKCKRLIQMFQKIKNWYQGESKIFSSSSENGAFIWLYEQRHWTANIVRYLVNFYSKHWEWLWSTLIAIAGLSIGILS